MEALGFFLFAYSGYTCFNNDCADFMKDGVQIWPIRRGIWMVGTKVIPPSTLDHSRSTASLISLHQSQGALGSDSRPSREPWAPSSEEDCPYLENLPGPTLEDEFITSAWYTRHTSTTLALRRDGR